MNIENERCKEELEEMTKQGYTKSYANGLIKEIRRILKTTDNRDPRLKLSEIADLIRGA